MLQQAMPAKSADNYGNKEENGQLGAAGGPTGGRSEHHAGPPVPGVGDGGRVCPGKCPLGASVRCVLEQIARYQLAPSIANNTVESQELTVGPVARIHSELSVGGRGMGARKECACQGSGVEGAPRGPSRTLRCLWISSGGRGRKKPPNFRSSGLPGASEA